jgi:hypothetical protein
VVRADITEDGLISPADELTQSILPQEGAAVACPKAELPSPSDLNYILTDALAQVAAKLLIFCRRGRVDINFPAGTAGMLAAICLAAEILVKIRIYRNQAQSKTPSLVLNQPPGKDSPGNVSRETLSRLPLLVLTYILLNFFLLRKYSSQIQLLYYPKHPAGAIL